MRSPVRARRRRGPGPPRARPRGRFRWNGAPVRHDRARTESVARDVGAPPRPEARRSSRDDLRLVLPHSRVSGRLLEVHGERLPLAVREAGNRLGRHVRNPASASHRRRSGLEGSAPAGHDRRGRPDGAVLARSGIANVERVGPRPRASAASRLRLPLVPEGDGPDRPGIWEETSSSAASRSSRGS